MRLGKIKWFDAEKGYGFIIPDTGGKDVILHRSYIPADMEKEMTPGVAVGFMSHQTNPTKAISVKLIDDIMIIKLPQPCSHTHLGKINSTGEVAIFKSEEDMRSWVEINSWLISTK